MPGARASILALVAAGVVAVLAACLAQAFAFSPNAQQGHGTEGAFATGLYERELGPTGPQRWTGERAIYTFAGLSAGPASLEVRVRGHRTPLTVLANGAELGTLPPERFVGRYELPSGPEHGRVIVELVTEGFRGGDGRVRGAFVDRVRVRPEPSLRPAWRTLLVFLLPACAIALASAASGFAAPAVVAFVTFACLVLGLLLRPDGLLYSPYAMTLAILLALAGLAAGVIAFAFERRAPGTRGGAFAAVLLALAVQGIAPVSPVMVASDVVFHANRLRDTLGGDWFPVSVTQHAVPFQIPYGVSFYALLVPLGRLGLDPVLLVTAGAGLAGVAASVALFGLFARRDPRLAVGATVALQLLPGTFTIHSYGNLSNAFGQATTVLFFCWWSGAATGGALVGALLYAVAGTSHLSSLIVLGVLSLGLVVARGRALRADRVRLVALGLGALATLAYYSHFVPLVLGQLPRLLEGGGQGKAGSAGALPALGLQLHVAVEQFGIPALLLAIAGLRALRGRDAARTGPMRDVAAYLAAVGLLALPAVVSPLEVRYLYALGLPVAVAAAAGYLRLRARGVVPRTGADLLALAQAGLAAYVIADCIFFRYRQ